MFGKFRGFVARNHKIASAAVVGAVVLAGSGVSGATGSTIVTTAFSSETTQLTTYMGLAAALVFVLLGIGVGIRLAVKWIKFAIGRGS